MGKRPDRSITYTILILSGVALALGGTVIAVIGIGGLVTFDADLGPMKIRLASLGLAIAVIGATLAGVVAVKLPGHVRPFGADGRELLSSRIMEYRGSFFFVFAALVGGLLVLSLVL